MTERKLKAAVIGVGLIGKGSHARVYQAYDRSELVMVCDLSAERAKAVGEELGVPWTTSLSDVARSDAELVSVATPDFAHAEPVLAMIDAGKHVNCEKPLASSTAEAREMVLAARTKGVKLFTNFILRADGTYNGIRQAVRDGEIGDSVMGYMRNSDTIWVPTKMLSWAGRSGPEWFLLSHAFDMLRYILGQEAHEVYATGTKRVLKGMGIDAFDAIQALVKFDSCFVTFETCWIIPVGWPSIVEVGLTLYGSKGRINFAAGNQGFDLSTPERFSHGRSGRRPAQKLHSSVTTFVDSILDNTPLLATGEDGLAATAIIEATLQSIAAGSPVRIDYALR